MALALPVAVGLAMLAPAGAGAVTHPTLAVGSVVAAQAVAAAVGDPVEATDFRTENQTLYANPDGTVTMDVAAVPIRVRKPGGWVPVNATLQANGDGTLSPVASALGLKFSGGGAAGSPLVTVTRGSRSLVVRSPFALGTPTVVGETARYSEVLPGVDLQVAAGPDSFSEVLVVKSATAAANPALTALTFPIQASGMSVTKRADGGLNATAPDGEVVLTGPAPTMWDSATVSSTPLLQAGFADDGTTTAGTTTRATTSAEGDQVADVGLTVTATQVTVTPDTGLLRGAGTTYPVYVDPALGASLNGWTMVNATFPTQEYWKYRGDSNNAEGMGHISTTLDGTHTKRLYYQFTTSPVNGKTIISATLRAFETHAYSCTASAVEAWQTGGISSATNWTNKPGTIGARQDSKTVAVGRVGCSPGGATVAFAVTPAVAYSASHNFGSTTLMLKAGSETSNSGWKRFRRDATLSITYNTTPATPTGLRGTEPPMTCAAGASRPVIPNDPPKLVARITDADGGLGQLVRGSFEIYTSAGTLRNTLTTAAVKPGLDYVVQAPTLPDGTYKWRVRANDGVTSGAYSGFCEFTVDGTKPLKPTLAPAPVTKPAFDTGQLYLNMPNAYFTVTPNDPTASRFKYALNSSTPTSPFIDVVLHPTFRVDLTKLGPVSLKVWTFDAAGNQSLVSDSLDFVVVPDPNAEQGRWRMDQTSGTAVPDALGVSAATPNGARPMTASGGTGWGEGRLAFLDAADRALTLNGSTGSAVTTATDVANFTGDVSVVASLKLSATTPSTRAVAISQENSGTAKFALGVVPQTNANGVVEQHLTVSLRAFTSTTEYAAASATPLQPGTWYHVVAVWKATTHELVLWVDGRTEGAVDVPVTLGPPSSALKVGSWQLSGVAQDFWPGSVDEVRAFNRQLTDLEIRTLVNEPH